MSPLLSAGVELMLVGMGTVFSFLTLLVFVTQLMSKTVQRFFPAAERVDVPGSRSEEEVAAITAAIALHRRR